MAKLANGKNTIITNRSAAGVDTPIYPVTRTKNVYDAEGNILDTIIENINTEIDSKQDALTFDTTPTANSTNPVTSGGIKTALDAKQTVLTFDDAPTVNSTNPVKSGGVYTALAGKQDTLTYDAVPTDDSEKMVKSGGIKTALDGKQDALTFDSTPTTDSLNPVTSGGVKTALDTKQDTLTYDAVPTDDSEKMVKSGGIKTALDAKQDTLTFDNTPIQASSNPVKSGGVYTALAGKQDTLTFDSTPTADSDNPVKSGGVYTALGTKQDTLTFDSTPTANSDNPVKSGGVYTALGTKQDTLTFDSTPTDGSSNPVTSGGVFTAVKTAVTDKLGVANGIATLDNDGKVPESQLPSYVDDVVEIDEMSEDLTTAKKNNVVITPETGKIYMNIVTNISYRWGGTKYAPMASSLALGETESTAYRGDRGKIAYDHSQATHALVGANVVAESENNGYITVTSATNSTPTDIPVYVHPGSGTNPHGTTKADLGLDNVENKSSATIRSEITSTDVTTALGYTPQDNSVVATTTNNGVMSSDHVKKLNSTMSILVSDTTPTSADFPETAGLWFQVVSTDDYE